MKILNLKKLEKKDLLVFDFDGTLVPTKSPMDSKMAKLLTKLLAIKKVAVIGGNKYAVFQELFLRRFKCPPKLLQKLFLFPTTSTVFYRYHHGWKKIYALYLNKAEVVKIKKAFRDTFKEIDYQHPLKTYGTLIENRGTQVSFSVYGQDIVKVLGKKGVKIKEQWLKNSFALKMKITRLMAKKLPNFEVRAAGFTTIDVTRKGIDKAYGIHQIQKHLKIPIGKMFFIGDAIFPGGNDYAAVRTGVDYLPIKNPEEVKKIIRKLVKNQK
jgi:hypothetical protein